MISFALSVVKNYKMINLVKLKLNLLVLTNLTNIQYQASGVDTDTREKKKEKDNGTISLVCGSIALGSIVFSWIPFVGIIGLVLSIVSIVFGNKAKDNSYGKTGRILGIIALVIQIVEFVIGIVVFCLIAAGVIKNGGYYTYISLFNLIGGLR